MVFQWFYDAMYSMNVFGTKHTYDRKFAEDNDLPALPDLSRHFSRISAFGNVKRTVDPRFPDNTSQQSKHCFTNFAVWRRCLEVHADNMDPEDPDAVICKKYQNLAYRSCTKIQVCQVCVCPCNRRVLDCIAKHKWLEFMEEIEQGTWMWMIGLNKRRQGQNPTVLVLDGRNRIVKVIDKADSDPNNYEKGESYLKYKKYY